MSRWGSRRDRAWSAAVLARYGRECLLRLPGCTTIATTADHIIPKSQRPDLAHDVANGRPACRRCNSRRKTTPLSFVAALDATDLFESAAPGRRSSRPISPPDPQKNGEEER